MNSPLCPTPFARIFRDTNTTHHFDREWNELPICGRCGGFEGSLLDTCPIQFMTFAESQLAYDAYGNRLEEFKAVQSVGGDIYAVSLFPTITQYNELARDYNDKILDLRTVSA